MRTKASNQNRIMRIITVPIRVLCKARDRYVKSMTNFAERGSYGNISGPAAMPRSFSVGSSTMSDNNEDQRELRELIRALSSTTTSNSLATHSNTNNNMNLYMQQHMSKSTATRSRRMPRSCSVGMGKIDEEGPCDFGEYNVNLKIELVYPRSMSHAVTTRSVVF